MTRPLIAAVRIGLAALLVGVLVPPVAAAAGPRLSGSDKGVPTPAWATATPEGDLVPVEIEPAGGADAAVAAVLAVGGRLDAHIEGFVGAAVPARELRRLADDPAIARVDPARRSYNPDPDLQPRTSGSPRQAGTVTGEHVGALYLDRWHAAGIRGQGVKVGIIDAGYDVAKWNAAVSTGDLPTPAGTFCRDYGVDCGNPLSHGAADNHGNAVAEVIHDAAPDAELYVAHARSTADNLAAVNWMIANGVRVISRSLGHEWDGPGDGRGAMAKVVDHAVANGITWFNSAGNYGGASGSGGFVRLNPIPLAYDAGTSSYWVSFPGYGFFLPIANCSFFGGVRWSDFGASFDSGGAATTASPTDFDVFLYDENHAEVGRSEATQATGAAVLPIENPGCYGSAKYLAIKMYTPGAAWNGGNQVNDTMEIMVSIGLGGSTNPRSVTQPAADSNNPGQISVGAIDPWDGTSIGSYSSWGPTNADPSPVKPDLVAVAGLSTQAYGYEAFPGTSAATPVAAGIGALVLSAGLASTPAQLAAYLEGSTWERGSAGADFTYGHGELHLSENPPAAASNLTVTAAGTPGTIDPGDPAVVKVTVANTGAGAASGVRVDLTHSLTLEVDAVAGPTGACPLVSEQNPVGVPITKYRCDVGGLAGGASAVVTVTGRIPDADEASVDASATMSGDEDTSDNLASAVVKVVRGAYGGWRLAGSDRYATAANAALDRFSGRTVDVAYLAVGTNFPDALAGAALAGATRGPILLTLTGELPVPTRDALATLKPKKVVALGSTGVVSDAVLAAAASAAGGAATDRLGGVNRYDTAARIARAVPGQHDTVYLAVGTNFPDALAAGPATGGAPVVLTPPGGLAPETAQVLADLAPEKVVALGGRAVLPNEVLLAAQAAAGAAEIDRLQGPDRFATAVDIARRSFSAPRTVYVAVGSNFPDALGGGPLAVREAAPMLLTLTDSIPEAVATYLDELENLQRIVILGGKGVVSDAVKGLLEQYLAPLEPPPPGSGGGDGEGPPPPPAP